MQCNLKRRADFYSRSAFWQKQCRKAPFTQGKAARQAASRACRPLLCANRRLASEQHMTTWPWRGCKIVWMTKVLPSSTRATQAHNGQNGCILVAQTRVPQFVVRPSLLCPVSCNLPKDHRRAGTDFAPHQAVHGHVWGCPAAAMNS